MKKLKKIGFFLSLISIIFVVIVIFEFALLRLVGLQYESFSSLLFFFAIYIFLDIALSLIGHAIPKRLESAGIIQSSKGWLSFCIDFVLAFVLIGTIDLFLSTVYISWLGIIIFALISGLISWKLKEKDE
ncbi:MAG: YrvL family regulatory protein [Lysinibacillus sp.]